MTALLIHTIVFRLGSHDSPTHLHYCIPTWQPWQPYSSTLLYSSLAFTTALLVYTMLFLIVCHDDNPTCRHYAIPTCQIWHPYWSIFCYFYLSGMTSLLFYTLLFLLVSRDNPTCLHHLSILFLLVSNDNPTPQHFSVSTCQQYDSPTYLHSHVPTRSSCQPNCINYNVYTVPTVLHYWYPYCPSGHATSMFDRLFSVHNYNDLF